MKVFALKYKALIGVISVLLMTLDILLIALFGFKGQLLIFLYIMIGVVPLCGIFAICFNIFIPSISINYSTKTIVTDFVANEQYKNDKSFRNQGDVFYFSEIIDCKIDNKKLIISQKFGQTKTLYLNFFTKKQVLKISKEIEKIIKNK